MAAPIPSPPAADAVTLPVSIKFAPGVEQIDGIFVIAEITCALLPEGAHLLLDGRTNLLTLAAPCGCRVDVDLTRLLLNLFTNVAKPHAALH